MRNTAADLFIHGLRSGSYTGARRRRRGAGATALPPVLELFLHGLAVR